MKLRFPLSIKGDDGEGHRLFFIFYRRIGGLTFPLSSHRNALGRPTPIRFTDIEKAVFERQAEKEGLPLSRWIRKTLNNAMKQ
jgi:hypothetical protein